MTLGQRVWTVVLFGLGFFVWLFKPTYGETPLIPFSPLQIGIPFLGGVMLVWTLMRYRGQFPCIMRGGWSSVLLVVGNAFILLGTLPFLAGKGDGRTDAVLYVVRWLMPACVILTLHVAFSSGVTARSLVLGIFGGAAFTAICVELTRMGLNLPIHKMSDARYAGFLQHANQYGILLSGTAPFIIYLFYAREKWMKVLGGVMVAVYCLCLFQCMSKTNLFLFPLAMGAGLVCLSLRTPGTLVRAMFMLVVLGAVLFAAGWLTLEVAREVAPQDAAVLDRLFHDPREVKSLDERGDIWDEAIENIRRRPILGFGPGWTVDHMSLPHAHNLVLQFWLDTGASGVIGIGIIIVAVFLRTAGMIRESIGEAEPPSEPVIIQRMSGIGAVFSLFGNSMSASLSTATMMTFVVLVGLSFVRMPDAIEEGAHE